MITCQYCGVETELGIDYAHVHPSHCIRAVEARLASLEAVVKQTGPLGDAMSDAELAKHAGRHCDCWHCDEIERRSRRVNLSDYAWVIKNRKPVQPPAEPASAEKPVCKYVPLCMMCGQGAAGFTCSPSDPVLDCHLCGFKSRGRLFAAPAVPTAEPARCSPKCFVALPAECHPKECTTAPSGCTAACNAAGRPLSPAPESTPGRFAGRLGPCVSCPRPADDGHSHAESTPDVPAISKTETVQPIPPRPEAQGTVSHDDANDAVTRLYQFAPSRAVDTAATLRRYINETHEFYGKAMKAALEWTARDKAQAAEIERLKAEINELIGKLDDAARETLGALNERNGAAQIAEELHAELAALKQPAPSPGTAPAQEDVMPGEGQYDPDDPLWAVRWSAEFLQQPDGSVPTKAFDALVAKLTEVTREAEQRGRASRDGVVPAGAVEALREWREIPADSCEVVIRGLLVGAAHGSMSAIAARALRALASDAGKDGGR